MADEATQQVEDAQRTPATPLRGWRDLWQTPALLFGAVLLISGVVASVRSAPKDDFNGALDDVEALIQRERFDEALSRLNNRIFPSLAATANPPADVRSRFHLLRGDTIYLAQAKAGGDEPANDRAIIEEYEKAERLLTPLSPDRVARYAGALIALGRETEAIKRIRSLPDSASSEKQRMIRRVIEQALHSSGGASKETLELLGELSAAPSLSAQDRLWTIVTRAKLLLEMGLPDKAVDHLLLTLQRDADLSDADQAELYVLLARGYMELGRLDDADRNAQRAADRLTPADRLMGQVRLIEGRVAQSQGDLERAREEYAVVVSDFRAGPAWLAGLMGLAETQAMIGELARAFDSYTELVKQINEHGDRPGVRRRAVEESLLNQVSGALALEDYTSALRFAHIASDLYKGEKTPSAVLLALARSERLLADKKLNASRITPDAPPDLSLLDPASRAEVRSLYLDAGTHYLAHARDMIITDDDAFSESLWNAGDCFDLAGDLEKAVEVFSEYANGRPDDPRRPAAEFRLAQAHEARGQYGLAAKFYRGLIQESPNSGEGTRSYVWLAKTLLQDEEPNNDAEAEQLLKRVVDGGLLAPDALDFRAGLIELGRYYYRRRQFEPAIRRLDEAIRRFPQDRQIDELRYELADSHRMQAEALERTLKDAMPEAQRTQLDQRRRDHLVEAIRLYESVRTDLLRVDPRRLSEVQRVYLRNAYFYKADSAFDLADYDQAIQYYDTAAQRYAKEPISLVAMAQIVSAFIAQGRLAEARKANERARRRLSEFPDEAFESDDLPLSRKHWERWLDSTDALSRADQSTGTRTTTVPPQS